MARQLSAKLLDQLTSEYQRAIKTLGEENDKKMREIKSLITSHYETTLIKEVNSRLSDLGLTVTSKYEGYNRTLGKSVETFELSSFDMDEKVKSLYSEIYDEKKKQCEILKKKYLELDEWRINCIKSGQILPFGVPTLPPIDNGIRCE